MSKDRDWTVIINAKTQEDLKLDKKSQDHLMTHNTEDAGTNLLILKEVEIYTIVKVNGTILVKQNLSEILVVDLDVLNKGICLT